jgi:hypothetical protein
MATMTLGQFLRVPIPAPLNFVRGNQSVSDKPWAHQEQYTIPEWTINRFQTLDGFFSPLPLQGPNLGDLSKMVRYEQHAVYCYTEADVDMNFMEHIIMPLKNAFHDLGLLFGSKHLYKGKFVDLTIKPRGSSQTSDSFCVGEVKGTTMIDASALLAETNATLPPGTERLLREMKA